MSAESLLSVIPALPAVTGAPLAAQGGEGETASTFDGLLTDALAENDAAGEATDATPMTGDTPVIALTLPLTVPVLTQAQAVAPTAEDPTSTTPLPDQNKVVSKQAGPEVLPGAVDGSIGPQSPTAPKIDLTSADPDQVSGQVPVDAAAGAAEQKQPATLPAVGQDRAAAALLSLGALIPPPVRPGPQATTPLAPTDKSAKVSGEDTSGPIVLPGPAEVDPPRPPLVEPGAGSDRPRPGLTMKTDGPTPALDIQAPSDTPTTAGQSADTAPPVEDAATIAIARDASLSSLSRATIETTAHIAAQITRRLEGRSTRFEMALTPEGLGRVDVSLDIDADGQLAARLAFDNPLAATDLRGRVDELRRQLEDSGFRLSEDALQFTDRDPQSRGDGFDRQGQRAFARSNRLNADADLEISAPVMGRWMSLSLTPDRVDLKV